MKGDIRKARKKTSVIKDFRHNLSIAGLRVMTSDKTPDGIMVVSPAEGERLAKMVEDASRQKTLNDKEEDK